jgi:hypothetical protein
MSPEEMAEYVKRIVDAAPPLTEAQRARIGRIIRSAQEDLPLPGSRPER